METLQPILASHPFFQGFRADHLELIVGCASNARFDAGKFLFRQGEDAHWFYLVRQGKVALEVPTGHNPVIVQTVSEGDIIGWSWLIPPHNWRFDARAMDLTRVIQLDGACLRRKCEEDHHLGYELLKRFTEIMTQRLEATTLQLMDMYGARV